MDGPMNGRMDGPMDGWMYGWKDGWDFNVTLPQASDYGNQYIGKVHLWHKMKQLSNISPGASLLAVGTESRTHQMAAQHATTELTAPCLTESE